MSKPPSYRIIRRACGDGSEKWYVMVDDRYLAKCLADSGDWKLSLKPKDSTYPHRMVWDTRDTAEHIAREHWQYWLSEQELFTEEIHFDPEADVCT